MKDHRIINHIYKTLEGVFEIKMDEEAMDIWFEDISFAYQAYLVLKNFDPEAIFIQDESEMNHFAIGILRESYEDYMLQTALNKEPMRFVGFG